MFSAARRGFAAVARAVESRIATAGRVIPARAIHTATRVSTPRLLSLATGAGLAFAGVTAYGMASRNMFEVEAAGTPIQGVPGTRKERTFIAVKPDGVQRNLTGEIIKRFEAKGYKLVAIKMLQPTKSMAEKHYEDLKAKPFYPGLCNYFSSGPIVAMVFEGLGVVAGGRRLLGATNPSDSVPGSIRGDLCIDVGRNIIHGSDATDSAEHEIKLWFQDSEVVDFESSASAWVYEKK